MTNDERMAIAEKWWESNYNSNEWQRVRWSILQGKREGWLPDSFFSSQICGPGSSFPINKPKIFDRLVALVAERTLLGETK